MSFEFTAGIHEQPAVYGSVEKRDPCLVVEVDETRKVGVPGDETAGVAAALLVHESSYAFVDWRKLLKRTEADAVLGVEEHDSARGRVGFRNGSVGKVARLESDVLRNSSGYRV